VRNARLWAGLLGVEKTVVERVVFDEGEGVIVASVRPGRGQRWRCGICRRRSPGYDRGEGRRRWRALDLGHGGTVTCAADPLAVGDALTTSIGVKVKAHAGRGPIVNAATVTSDTADPNPTNNTASASTTVTR
jgi:Domain of unknown function DUF11